MKLSADEDSRPHSGAKRNEDKVLNILRSAASSLTDGRKIDVVLNYDRNPGLLLQHIAQRNLYPIREIGCRENQALGYIRYSRCPGREVQNFLD